MIKYEILISFDEDEATYTYFKQNKPILHLKTMLTRFPSENIPIKIRYFEILLKHLSKQLYSFLSSYQQNI